MTGVSSSEILVKVVMSADLSKAEGLDQPAKGETSCKEEGPSRNTPKALLSGPQASPMSPRQAEVQVGDSPRRPLTRWWRYAETQSRLYAHESARVSSFSSSPKAHLFPQSLNVLPPDSSKVQDGRNAEDKDHDDSDNASPHFLTGNRHYRAAHVEHELLPHARQ